MKTLLTTLTALTLVAGVSGCFVPVHDRRDDHRDDRYQQGYRDDCWNRDGHRYCRED